MNHHIPSIDFIPYAVSFVGVGLLQILDSYNHAFTVVGQAIITVLTIVYLIKQIRKK